MEVRIFICSYVVGYVCMCVYVYVFAYVFNISLSPSLSLSLLGVNPGDEFVTIDGKRFFKTGDIAQMIG